MLFSEKSTAARGGSNSFAQVSTAPSCTSRCIACLPACLPEGGSAESAEQPGKMVNHLISKSSQPRSASCSIPPLSCLALSLSPLLPPKSEHQNRQKIPCSLLHCLKCAESIGALTFSSHGERTSERRRRRGKCARSYWEEGGDPNRSNSKRGTKRRLSFASAEDFFG